MTEKKNYNLFCVIGQLGNGGTERQLYLFLKYLDRSKYSPLVVVSGKSGGIWDERFAELGISVEFLGDLPSILKFIRFRWLVFKYSPKTIFSWSFFTNAFLPVRGSARFIGSMRQGLEASKAGISDLRAKLCLKPEKIVVNSGYIGEELSAAGVPEDNISVIFNIFESSAGQDENREALRQELGIAGDKVVVVGVGRNSPTKDFPLFVDTFAKAAVGNDKLYGLLIGSGGLAMQDKIAELGLEEKFTVTGEVPNARRLLPAADIFFLSSAAEGMPNVLIEALDAGLAPLAMEVGGVEDVLSALPEDLKEKVIIRERKADKAALELEKLSQDINLRGEISEKARQRLDDFGSEKIMRQYYKLLEE
jgi:glycosyltransferase involved in cell wall biosynthesis